MKYLIVKCESLNDPYGWEADRTPMYITDDWDNLPTDYDFEVYGIFDDGRISSNPIKHYDEYEDKNSPHL